MSEISSTTVGQRQSLPLEAKILMSKRRIRDWYNHWHGNVYVAFSGGKDSTVLLHLVRQIYPNVPAVFVDTGLQFPEIKQFVKNQENVITLKPRLTFKEVIEKHGYPVVSKKIANTVRYANAETNNTRYQCLCGTSVDKKTGKLSQFNCKKWKFLLDAPFKISDYCCTVMKKQPMVNHMKATGTYPMIGMMASESRARMIAYRRTGCNAFDLEHPQSQPIAFWTNQDILKYLKEFNISHCQVYGEIKEDDQGQLYMTREQRTGCIFCMFGIHLEKEPNRFQRLKESHPHVYEYCIQNLGCGEVLEYMDIPY